MTHLHLTRHALERLAQRGMALSDVELIMEIGSEVDDGYLVLTKDRQAIERALKEFVDRIRRLEGKRLVVSGGHLVTGYHASEREKRRLLKYAPQRDLRHKH